MTSPTTQPRRRLAPVIILAAMALTGCFEARLQWSPDGSHAAVRTRHGLYLSDSKGKLSDMLLPDVRAFAWMSDGKRLAVAPM